MKNIMIILILLITSSINGQTNKSNFLSEFKLGILGGTTFNSISNPGGNITIEGKTNITSNLDIKLSVGYSGLMEEVNYTARTYNKFVIQGIEGYNYKSYYINEISYSILPINIGIEYKLFKKDFTPLGIFEFGFNYYSGEEQFSGVEVQPATALSEIPNEFLTYKSKDLDGSTYSIGLGAGINYNISKNIGLTLRYIYRYNEAILNSNQILVGILF